MLQHEDREFVLLNIFLKHFVLVRAVDASYVPGDHFHWLTVDLEGKNFVSWEYCPYSTSLVPMVASLVQEDPNLPDLFIHWNIYVLSGSWRFLFLDCSFWWLGLRSCGILS